MKQLQANQYTRLSLVSITLTAALTSIHHIYRLGLELLVPAIIVTILPYLLMRWFMQTGNKGALWAYGLLTSLIVIWFGIIDGFLDHVMKALGFQNTTFLPGSEAKVVETVFSLWSPEAGHFFYEWTGILTFIVGVFAAYYDTAGLPLIGGLVKDLPSSDGQMVMCGSPPEGSHPATPLFATD